MTAIAGALPGAFRMEQGMFVEPHLLLRVLPAIDAAALSAVVTPNEQTKRSLAGRCGAYEGGTIRLK